MSAHKIHYSEKNISKWWDDFDKKYTKEDEIKYQNERWDVYEKKVEKRIKTARGMINGKNRGGEADRKWLDQFSVGKGHGLDICSGSMPIKNAMGVDVQYLGPLCFGRTSGSKLFGHGQNTANFIITNYFDLWGAPLEALNEWYRVLKPGGILAFVCRNAEVHPHSAGPLVNGNRNHLQTPLTIQMYLNRVGFEVVEVSTYNGSIRVVARKPGVRVADSVMIFNETDLLKVRLSEHYGHVDQFFVVEATKTHSGKPKKLYYDEKKDEFEEWSDKIEHIIVDADKYFVPAVDFQSASSNEDFQREAVRRLMPEVWNSFDYFILSDLDEIINNWNAVEISMANKVSAMNVCMRFFFYFIDAEFPVYWTAENRIRKTRVKNETNVKKFTGPIGWHFSTLGGTEKVMEKLAAERSSVRTEKFNNLKHINNSIKELRTFFRSKRTAGVKDCLTLNTDLSYLPKYMLSHWDTWEKYLYENFEDHTA